MTKQTRDIFICHASEDKEAIVRPMVEAFDQAGLSCWYDEAEIQWGDSITSKVNEGLRTSRYVIVVLSSAFLKKNWPQRELNAAMNQEASSGKVRILPLVVGTDTEQSAILKEFPLLNDKRYLPWDGDLRKIVTAMKVRVKGPDETSVHSQAGDVGLRIPLPKIQKTFAQRDRDLFLRTAFMTIQQYYKKALEELSQKFQEVETDFALVHNFKFVATIYVGGEVSAKCKIWIGGGLTATDCIAYQAGEFTMDADNSFNDFLSVSADGQSLGFKPSGMWIGNHDYSPEKLLTPEQTAEYLWRRFTERLG